MSFQSDMDRRKEPNTDAVIRVAVETVRPNYRKIRSVVERRLHDERRNARAIQPFFRPIVRWALSASLALIAIWATYTFLVSPNLSSDRFFLLPLGQTLIGSHSVPIEKPQEIRNNGQTVQTLTNSFASLIQANQYTLRLAESTSIRVTRPNRVQLEKGSLYSEVVKRIEPTNPFSIEAGDLTVTVLGTKFSIDRTKDKIEVSVKEGQVHVTSQQGEEVILSAGKGVTFSQGKLGSLTDVPLDKIAPWSQVLIREEASNQQWHRLMRHYFPSRTF